mmetsp:Transcript_10449/g.14064  ORF Transcript_10449/g.14064 Transcript_10449/m.14064 type:complete len:85 (+) Transcript_10449:328-582(+)
MTFHRVALRDQSSSIVRRRPRLEPFTDFEFRKKKRLDESIFLNQNVLPPGLEVQNLPLPLLIKIVRDTHTLDDLNFLWHYKRFD